ncbi:MAG: hypothetical protein MJA29_07390 [Candidatus Omnitrophica bacterium]|nr:hypothetical protein [Candidatus Omnitrophota bacterium]
MREGQRITLPGNRTGSNCREFLQRERRGMLRLLFIVLLLAGVCFYPAGAPVLGSEDSHSQGEISSEGAFEDFTAWMRRQGYSASIIEIYRCNYRDPVLKLIIEDFLKIKAGDLRWPQDSSSGYAKFKAGEDLVLTFVEVIPSDEEAVFHRVDREILAEFNEYLTQRFGKKIIIDHKAVTLDHKQAFGDILFSYDALFVPRTHSALDSFMKQFEAPCMVRFDAEEIDNREVAAVWEIRHCAVIMGKELRLSRDVDVFDKYAHEFGHNIGLEHLFADPRNPPRNAVDYEFIEKNEGKHVGIDDIMIKPGKAKNEKTGRYVSPLSRYVLEPVEGYADEGEFAAFYNSLYGKDVIEEVRRCACGE